MNESVLQLRGLAKTYNTGTSAEVEILRGVDLTVEEG